MFVELLVTAATVQQDLMKAYEATDRMREIGLYMLVQNNASLKFFEQITPPDNCHQLYESSLKWQRLGIELLEAELDANVDSELMEKYENAANEFAAALAAV